MTLHTNRNHDRFARISLLLLAAAASGVVFSGACTDAGEGDATGGAGTGGAATSTTSGSTSSSSATSSSTGTGTGTGGAGGCLPASTTAQIFSIQTTDLCVVATYTAPDLTIDALGAVPTWGRHHGPLTSTVMGAGAGADVHIERWTPSGTTLSKVETVISGVTQIPSTGFVGAQTLDMPFGGLTAVSWTGQDFAHQGGLVLFDATSVAHSYLATGMYGTAVVGTAASSRVLYTGLSALDGPTNSVNALYAADFANGTLGTSQAIATWGEATGPVAIDSAGNALAINTKFSDGTQELRAFATTIVAPGQPATAGQTLLVTDGFGNTLAAVAPKAAKPGLALFQPETGTGTHGDVLVVRYTVNGANVTEAGHEAILKLAVPDTTLTLMTDDQDRVWVGAAGAQGAVFHVLARP